MKREEKGVDGDSDVVILVCAVSGITLFHVFFCIAESSEREI